jgi:hypothetical protein
MLGIHRPTETLFGRRAARLLPRIRPRAHRRRRAWTVEYLEGRALMAQFAVTNLLDGGPGSLRQAIVDSNETPGPNQIDFAAGLRGTITLTGGELAIANNDVAIVGPGRDVLSVSGTGNSRVFEITSGVAASLSGLTIIGGKADDGGGIYNNGTVTISASNISGNSTSYGGAGGGIYNNGTVAINASTITGNSTGDGKGGGIFNGGTLTLTSSSISDNTSEVGCGCGGGEGGGVFNTGKATIDASTINGNSASGGGGIYNDYGDDTLLITASTISGNSAANGGGIYNEGTVTISASTISGNSVQDRAGYATGGGIYNTGTATINTSTISGNNSDFTRTGGGILNEGTLKVDTSTISGNSGGISIAAGMVTIDACTFSTNIYGGDILNGGTGTVTVNASTFSSGIWNGGTGTVTVNASTFSGAGIGAGIGNYGTMRVYASTFSGAGIVNDFTGTMTINTSTISGNSASSGGGIVNFGTVTIDASTISGNSADYGGGIYNTGTVTIDASTISGNRASDGGGIYNLFGTVTLATSIVAGNSAPAGQAQDGQGGFNSLGHNLIGDTEGSSGWVATDLLNVDPRLGPLQDNGGPTMTMALLPGSPAIDAGNNALIPPGVRYDQRGPGFNRIVNGTVDIGAYEFLPAANDTVAVGWGTQTAPLRTAADGRRLLPAGRNTDLPWLGIDRFRLTLGQAQALTPADVTVNSAIGVNYGPVTVTGSGTTYTITLARPIDAADRVTITIVNPGVSMFNRRIDVLPGDANDDGTVDSRDMVLIRNAIQGTGDPLMIGWADIDGDGVVGLNDYLAARKKLGSRLP